MTDSKLLDSNIWIDYFIKGSFKEIIESEEQLFISPLSLFEIKLKFLNNKEIKKEQVEEKILFVKKKSDILDINLSISELAAEISHEKNLPAIDSLIYASAKENKLTLLTMDNDFRGLDNVKILS